MPKLLRIANRISYSYYITDAMGSKERRLKANYLCNYPYDHVASMLQSERETDRQHYHCNTEHSLHGKNGTLQQITKILQTLRFLHKNCINIFQTSTHVNRPN